MIPDEPITRKEMYYAKILGGDIKLPEPITREERYLNAIAEQGTGGGGGGGGGETYTLPVASEDVLGGVKCPAKTEAETEPVHIDGQGYLFVKSGDVTQSKKMDVILEPEQWTGEEPQYLYEIDLPDTTADQSVRVTAAVGLTEVQINAFADAVITGKEQTDNKIVLQAVNKPNTELPIVIEIGGVVTNA